MMAMFNVGDIEPTLLEHIGWKETIRDKWSLSYSCAIQSPLVVEIIDGQPQQSLTLAE